MKAFIYRGILLVALCPSAIVLSCSQPESSPKLPAEMTVEEAKQALFDQEVHFSTITFFQTVRFNKLDLMPLFFAAGIDVNVRAEYGDTALMSAASNPDPTMARLLMAEGADVNLVSEFGHTALHLAAQQNVVVLVEELLALGAEVDGVNSEGETPLILASRRGAVEIVNMLLARNARLDIRTRGWDALGWARKNNYPEVVALLTAAAEERAAQVAKDSPSPPPVVAQAEPAQAPEPAVEPPNSGVEPVEHDDHFEVVVYGIPEDLPYDTRLFERMVPAMVETFPVAEYAGMGEIEEAYESLMADPSSANGEKLEEIIGPFTEDFDEAETERFQEMYFDIVSREMTLMRVKVARATLDALVAVFPLASHPLLGEVVSAVDAFERAPEDGEELKVDEAMGAFDAALNVEERSDSESIQQTMAELLMAGDPEEFERRLIDGWVDDLERNRGWINTDVGAVVSPDAFDALAENMDYSQVEDIVGREGKQTTSLTYDINGNRTTSLEFEWSWPMASGTTAKLVVWFLNGELRVKCYCEV